MFRGVSGAILALAVTMAACAPAHAGPISGVRDAAAVDPRPLYLAVTAAPDAGPPPEAIREAQELLSALGYRPGPADGSWGGRTASAFRAFLRDAGLPAADGLTPDTLRALRRLAAQPAPTAPSPPAPAPAAPAPVAPQPSCKNAAEGANCWNEVSNRPGCYFWDYELEKSRTAVWSGQCRGNKVEGRGTLTRSGGSWSGESLPDAWIEGEFREGKLQGHGIVTTSDGGRYEGEWRDSKLHGQGTYTSPDGGRYEGEWRDSKRHGQGTFAWPSGERYAGGWRDDKPQGWGVFTGAGGKNYAGEWSRGCYEKGNDRAFLMVTEESCGF